METPSSSGASSRLNLCPASTSITITEDQVDGNRVTNIKINFFVYKMIFYSTFINLINKKNIKSIECCMCKLNIA